MSTAKGLPVGEERNIRIAQSCARDAREAVAELHKGITQPGMSLVLFFCSSHYDREALAAEIARRFAGVPVVGCTTAGEIGPAGCRDHSLTGVSFAGEVCTAVVGRLGDLGRFRSSDGVAFARELRRRLGDLAAEEAQGTFAFLLVDGLFGHEEQVAHALQQGLGDIPLVGGSAGDSLSFESTFVYWDGRFTTDTAVLVLAATPLPLTEFKTQHFVPTDERLVVTDADPDQRLVREINGLPAAAEYARLLGLDPAQLGPTRFAASPVVVLIDGADYVRSIQRVEAGGGLKFYCAIERGVVLRVARGVDLVDNLEAALARVRSQIGPPQLVLAFDCILRKLEIDESGLQDAVSEVLRRNNVVGFNTYGEQFCGVHVNQTLTAIAFGAADGRHTAEGSMGDAVRHEGDADVQALKAEIVRLNKVVDALMDHAEAGTRVEGSDFGLFQTTIMLQDQVRAHTEELEEALRRQEEHDEIDASASAARDMQTLRRTAALQIQVLELVVQQKDVGELVERVATILDIPIVLFDTRGQVVCASRSVPASPDLVHRAWAAYSDLGGEPGPAGSVTSAGERVFFRDVLVMGRVERVLAAVTTRHRPSEFAGASLLFLQQLVTLDLLRGKDELRMRRRLRRGLLQDVLTGDGTADELRVRLQAQGFDDESVLRIAIVEPAAARPRAQPGPTIAEQRGTSLLRALDSMLSRRRSPYLTSSKGSRATVLTALLDEETTTARALLAQLREAAAPVLPEGVVIGCSSPLTGIAGAARGLQQAKAACISARVSRRPEDTAIFEELSGHFRLLDALDARELSDIVRRTFGPLLDYDDQHHASLCKTLRTLFEHRLAVQETSDALHIHRNTLQKRLAHAEQLLGIDLSDLDAIVDLRLGLHAAELLGEPLG